mgnify:CR=1 FL=1
MEFTIPITTILPALRRAADVADRKSTMPMLANVCLRTNATSLVVAATDLNTASITTIPLIGAKPGGLTLNAKALLDIVANLPAGDVSVKKVENNWAEVKAKKVSYRIVGLPDRDFPKVPDDGEATFVATDAGALLGMLRATQHSICSDETRFHLNGVLFESNGTTARMVSTDGHRLAKADRTLAGPALSSGVIIPRKGVLELRKLLDGAKAIEIAVKLPYFFARRDGSVLAVKLINAQFPPYEQVIPKKHDRRAIVERELLVAAVKRCALMASETRGLKLELAGGGLTISTDHPERGDVREEVDCDFAGEAIGVGVNPKYTLDLIAVLEDVDEGAIAIELNGALDPIVLRSVANPDAFVGVVMPMRI